MILHLTLYKETEAILKPGKLALVAEIVEEWVFPVDADLERLVELWPMLVLDDRAALLAHAEHLAALRDGATLERAAYEISSH